MQISSTNTGFVSGPGPSSVAPSAARKPVVESSANAQGDVSSAVNARALQQIAPPVVSADVSRTRVLARQHEGITGLSGNAQTGRLNSETVAQRAVMEYTRVATQEQRFELTGILVGIDVFA